MKGILTIFLFALAHVACCQYPNVLISTMNDPEEVSICINPKNPSQVVAGSNTDNVYYSTDGGLTWVDFTLTDSLNGVWGDPIIFTDTAGIFYYTHLSNPPAGSWIDRIVCQKSTDGGATWSAGTYMGLNGTKAQDKEGCVVNQANNEIYVTWTQFDDYGSAVTTDSSVILFSKSSDAGLTWSAPTRLSKYAGDCIDSDNTVEGAVPAVGPAGEIYVTWIGINGLMFNKSFDGGLTWLPVEQNILSVPGGWDYNISGLQRCNGLPAMVCDLSGGPNHGTLYINWTDQRNGTTDTDVWFIKSTDGGNTWTSPLRVNDDAPGKQQFLTWMTVDQSNGYIYCIFYDRRNFSTGNQTDVYLARSVDGGNTFTNYQVNDAPFIPSPLVFFGDYTSISAVNNMVRPMWMEYGSGTLSVWTAIVDGTTLGMNENPDNSYKPWATLQNNPNPFTESTVIAFELENPSVVTLFIYNSAGKKVATLYENEKFKKGHFNYVLKSSNFNLVPGVYYYTMWVNGVPVSKRMVVR